jgi:hypothetical protein
VIRIASLTAALVLSGAAFVGPAAAQGVPRGIERGAAEGNRAAGPVGGIVGGAVGGAVGGVNGVLGIDPGPRHVRRAHRRVRHHR